ncbi:uncharacterized protein TRIVIDRAFT_203051 [Trichoderma virens Gv29-8]|uniref:Uncharacterized protein n=1 Tax=Hypocrea virens (strain Gv29-8 / FGSC 10586) TaxID=413071 RepID=G9MZA2_HYPVG|nr:uncharacterized protein TRIVIDRAFT_203051 [Trichoderma virens Gv29-8]EHK20428.1 hypothetical protein TRIVIDRAFT_203051 [Trichoderma virens Gv29-8]UKZ47086.1 hypothetical protein TrVGV298_001300 [Trichoderma virens]
MEDIQDPCRHIFGPSPPPPRVTWTTEKKLEREDIMNEMQPLLLRLRGKWTEELAADIAATLTPQKLQVMEPQAKGLLSGWIYQQDDRKYVQWLNDAEEDRTSITWVDEAIIPGPEYWSCTLLMICQMNELDEAVEKLTPEQKPLFKVPLMMIRGFIECVEWHRQQRKLLPQMDFQTMQRLIHFEDGK